MSKRWKPGLNEVFWYINSGNKIDYTTNNGFGCDEEKIAAGNCFFTKAEAESAAEKVKALLLSLHGEPPTTSSQLQKLTAEVFDRPDCPEWAKYAAVDSNGAGYYYSEKPFILSDAFCWGIVCSETNQSVLIYGVFNNSDWKNSLIELPANLPDWCKVGEWVYLCNGTYSRIASINDCHVNLENGISVGKNSIHEEMVSARLRPYNADEMKALVGKVIEDQNNAHLIIGFIKPDQAENLSAFIRAGQCWITADRLLSGYTLNGKPCGVLEHLNENGEWVE